MSSNQLSTLTANDLASLAEKILSHEDVTRVPVTQAEAKALLAVCEKPQDMPTPADCLNFVEFMIGCYPNLRANDPEIYTGALAEAFSKYPLQYAKEVARELPSETRYLPSVYEITQALKAKVERRKAIHARARYLAKLEKEKGPDPKEYVAADKAKKILDDLAASIRTNQLQAAE